MEKTEVQARTVGVDAAYVGLHFSIHHAGCERVYRHAGHAIGLKLRRHVTGQHVETRFGGAVGAPTGYDVFSCAAGDVEDTAVTLLNHDRQDVAGHLKRADEIAVDIVSPFLRVGLKILARRARRCRRC